MLKRPPVVSYLFIDYEDKSQYYVTAAKLAKAKASRGGETSVRYCGGARQQCAADRSDASNSDASGTLVAVLTISFSIARGEVLGIILSQVPANRSLAAIIS